MAKKIETTTKKFKAGVAFTDQQIEVTWESTGHLSAELLDASGTVALADRKVTAQVPGEGTVELTTDADGKLFHADVPFQDYDLELDGGVKVAVPAVASAGDVQRRIVPEVKFGFAHLELRDRSDNPLAGRPVALTGPDGKTVDLTTDDDGLLDHPEPLAAGPWKVAIDDLRGEIELPNTPSELAIVNLASDEAE